MTVGTQEARPRAFDPSQASGQPVPQSPPGWDQGPERRVDDGRTLAGALGWLSLALGVAELLAPERIAEFLGVDEEHEELIRLYGLREIASGVGILAQRREPTPWIWSRIAGDFLDLATLGVALRGGHRGRVTGAIAMVAGVTALDLLCAKQLSARSR